jgi:hypothetical protein
LRLVFPRRWNSTASTSSNGEYSPFIILPTSVIASAFFSLHSCDTLKPGVPILADKTTADASASLP